ncbi:MAG: quinone oxidoreductase [Candidatus Rokubacteria bacterium]|nr:quinone oxidoreductase [Candidatus Rokubacteria bacterium]
MKAVRVQQFGGPEAMKLDELPTPAPGPGQARVKIEAAGVNFIDIYQRSGLLKGALPLALGLEGAGTVEAVGPNVTEVKVGDRVAWTGVSGSYATHNVIAGDRLVVLPAKLSFQDGAGAMLQGMTAHYLSHTTYPLKPGDSCLVHAAAGGVGLLLCQMAKTRGARVIGTVSTEAKAKLAREAGAEEVILYTQQDFEAEVKRLTGGKGVNVVYDSVGKDTFDKSLNCLALRGYLVLYGQSSGPVPPFDAQVLNAKGSLFLTRPSLFHYTDTRQALLQRAGEVLGWIEAGKLRLRVERTYPLAEAAEAHKALAGRQTTGKILLLP